MKKISWEKSEMKVRRKCSESWKKVKCEKIEIVLTYQKVDSKWHDNTCNEEISKCKGDNEVIGHRLERFFLVYTKNYKNVTKYGQDWK